jgi:hypothetical protein
MVSNYWLLIARSDVGLEVSTEKTMFTPHEQYVRRNHSKKTEYVFFERVGELKYLGMTMKILCK